MSPTVPFASGGQAVLEGLSSNLPDCHITLTKFGTSDFYVPAMPGHALSKTE
jgi:hypothetical protein